MEYVKHLFTVYVGDASDNISTALLAACREQLPHNLLADEPWTCLKEVMPTASTLFFAHQVHGVDGHVVTKEFLEQQALFSVNGDYLLTNEPGVAIGVLTADCLPIVLYDRANGAAAVIHAGWRSAVAGIAAKAVRHMHEVFGTEAEDLKVTFGPCAGQCCYQVSPDFVDAIPAKLRSHVIERSGSLYFDLVHFNEQLLLDVGVQKERCDFDSWCCTICSEAYHSYRRDKERAGRQMTVVCL